MVAHDRDRADIHRALTVVLAAGADAPSAHLDLVSHAVHQHCRLVEHPHRNLRRPVGMTLHERGTDLRSEVQEMRCCRAVIVEARVPRGLRSSHDQMPQRLDRRTDRAVVDPYRPYRVRSGGSLTVFRRRLHDDLGSGFRSHQVDRFLKILDPRADSSEFKEPLAEAGIDDRRLYDGSRQTAGTILKELGETRSCPPRKLPPHPQLRPKLRPGTAARLAPSAAAASAKKQKPQVTASENPGASTEPPSGFEPETYALRVVRS